jgi:hypothetical protein
MYYSLLAFDSTGRAWQCPHVLPEINPSFFPDHQHVLVTGNLYELQRSWDLPIETPAAHSEMRRTIFDDVEVPPNATTKTEVTVAGRRRQVSVSANVARLSSCGCDFTFVNEPGKLSVEVISGERLPPRFEMRIVEALQFVTARLIWWISCRTMIGRTETERFRAPKKYSATRLQPPIDQLHLDATGDVWTLFVKYLEFIASCTDNAWHPLSSHLYSIIEGGFGSIDAEARSVCAALEGIAKTLFPDYAYSAPSLKAAVDSMCDHVSSWPGLSGWVPDELASFRTRACRVLDGIRNPRAQDILQKLIEAGAITPEYKNAWTRLRHVVLHGKTFDDLQEMVTLTARVTVLTYQLVFKAIGYEGHYRDYGADGWHRKKYPSGEVVTEKGAVAPWPLS